MRRSIRLKALMRLDPRFAELLRGMNLAWISHDDSFRYRETMICIAVDYAFSSAGVSPAGLHCTQKHKNTGGTPALPRPRPKHLFSCGVTAARTFVRNAG